jgi:hypothetical protein
MLFMKVSKVIIYNLDYKMLILVENNQENKEVGEDEEDENDDEDEKHDEDGEYEEDEPLSEMGK